ncbi:armadillo repeat-containing protein 6 [Lethenteron reissneri]|uniref:armadillo repeat-containing protein 6 n=1 Tax=Lethenteron reissneri TaxID=7753 RepID=UPI002AB73917|nr:armadillo repeat-containing protein 6 [Lethenteron reissneri]
MGSKRISQETFDGVVRENIAEFSMEPEEALQEAVEQFELQGVNLTNIVKEVPKVASEESGDEEHEVLKVLRSVEEAALRTTSLAGVVAPLELLTAHCRKEFSQRNLIALHGAYAVLVSICKEALAQEDTNILTKAVLALAAFLDGQPDILDTDGQELLIKVLSLGPNVSTMEAAARAVRASCVKHEANRQALVKLGVLPLLTGAVAVVGAPNTVREACAALRVMTFDDDIRVPFGQAHDHAKMIVLENSGLKVLVEASKAYPNSLPVLSELCATIAKLAVRNEFCQDIVELGGLDFTLALLADYLDHQDLVKNVLSTLRAIAANDDVKEAVVAAGGTNVIVMAMNHHLGNPQLCEQACAALSVLALRNTQNCSAIIECGGALAILQAMKNHPKEANVQRQACMVLRNLVSRTQELCKPLLELGAEPLILQARANHSSCHDAAKAALRDLGCSVKLTELWTGEKGSIGK